jgi:hypothetical protein
VVTALLANEDDGRAGAPAQVLPADPSLTSLGPRPGNALLADAVATLARFVTGPGRDPVAARATVHGSSDMRVDVREGGAP